MRPVIPRTINKIKIGRSCTYSLKMKQPLKRRFNALISQRTEQVNKDATHSLSIIEVAVQRRCRVMRLGINHIEKLAPDFSEPPNSAAKICLPGAHFQIFGVRKKQNKMCFFWKLAVRDCALQSIYYKVGPNLPELFVPLLAFILVFSRKKFGVFWRIVTKLKELSLVSALALSK